MRTKSGQTAALQGQNIVACRTDVDIGGADTTHTEPALMNAAAGGTTITS
ncbi:hypothetical protein KC878_04375 [Candidatus Saccharibacteria bacterium]|nr:hypothetical protein [Candidatus Saccharibacteria bacterium]MCB9821436.1 hypothetical protein [Candidatus Nomurabacteria bacterium]